MNEIPAMRDAWLFAACQAGANSLALIRFKNACQCVRLAVFALCLFIARIAELS